MLFEKIYIKNLFSYYDEAAFDLAMPENKGNVAIISGRNGYGKTSFINSVKLLFSGPTESLRSLHTGFRLSERLYILGQGEKWLGIMNRKAREEDRKHFGIRIHWREKAGTVIADRSWLLSGENAYDSRLHISASFLEDDLEKEEAQNFLNERLPQDYIPYFFFDCEQIQTLAEDNQKAKLEQMERILNIAPIETLREYIGIVERQFKKDAMVGDANLELTQLENKKKELLARQIQLLEEKEDIEDKIAELDDRIKAEDHYLNSMRSLNIIRNEDKLKEQKVFLQKDIEERADEIAQKLPVNAPLLANVPLIQKAVHELKKLTESKTVVQTDILHFLANDLPSAFEKPPSSDPPLTESQVAFYKNRLKKYINALIPKAEETSDALMSIEKKKAEKLLETLNYYEHADTVRIDMARQLHQLSQKKNELHHIEQKLEDVSSLSAEKREEYVRRKAENNERREHKGRHQGRIDQLKDGILSIDKEFQNINQEISKKRLHSKIDKQIQKKLKLAGKLKAFFKNYKLEFSKISSFIN